MNGDALARLETRYGVHLETAQERQIQLYLKLLLKWNRKINLTSLDKVEKILERHFFESFWGVERFLPAQGHVADIGSGPGFPGMAMKLYRPSLHFTLIERQSKRITFLKEVRQALKLDVQLFHGRAEIYPGWDSTDLAVTRGLKPSTRLVELLRHQGAPLLVFHGHSLAPSLSGMEVLQQRRVPHSRQRHASLLR
ncbi:MAG: 16S rRNA (guanine(527)-N(7))-methyltransferase RsmG [Acidobacteriota bacterium]